MFARLRGAIDSQIASEQAKARPPPRRPRADSLKGGVEKDPSEFEDADNTNNASTSSASSGTRTPGKLEAAMDDPLGAVGAAANAVIPEPESKNPAAATPGVSASPSTSAAELPTDVRVKLRKLEKIEAKYAGEFCALVWAM